jgi:ribosomal protein RSM22 (predicted rRNA methylase)
MAWIVPVELEEVVHAAARAVLGDAPLATAALTRAIIDRSRRYTSERDRQATDPVGDLAARAMFFTIADAMKIAIPLGELMNRGVLPAARPLRLLDLGAGCGAMSLGAITVLGAPGSAPGDPLRLEITAIDRDARALAIARDAVRQLAARTGVAATITTHDDDITRTRLPAADLVVIGTALNELAAEARLDLVRRALASITDDGAVILIEPALRDTSRALHELRDAVLTAGAAHVFAPCTRTFAPCPALADPRDWCHEDRALALPRRTAELARLTHLRDGGMKLAYLVLRRHPLALVVPTPDRGASLVGPGTSDPLGSLVDGPTAWRVVSAPMPAKGKLEIIGCSAAGRIPLRLLRRHRAPDNRSFEDADRGDVLVIAPRVDPPPDAGRVEITRDTRVERIEPARRPSPGARLRSSTSGDE